MGRESETAPGFDRVWEMILDCQGREFFTAKGLVFRYQIRGGEMFVDRRSKSITRATVEKAFRKILEDTEHTIQGPKKLGVFGAPYLWAIFAGLGLAGKPAGPEGADGRKAPQGR